MIFDNYPCLFILFWHTPLIGRILLQVMNISNLSLSLKGALRGLDCRKLSRVLLTSHPTPQTRTIKTGHRLSFVPVKSGVERAELSFFIEPTVRILSDGWSLTRSLVVVGCFFLSEERKRERENESVPL